MVNRSTQLTQIVSPRLGFQSAGPTVSRLDRVASGENATRTTESFAGGVKTRHVGVVSQKIVPGALFPLARPDDFQGAPALRDGSPGRLVPLVQAGPNARHRGVLVALCRHRIPEIRLENQGHAVEQPPIFVLGFWRSGTTLLHNLISSDPQLAYPNYYQCLYPHHFLSTEWWLAPPTARFLPDTRPMDNVAVGWDMPQEDEIALCVLSLASCYLQVLFHDRVDKYQRFHDMADCTEAERKAWMDSLDYLIRKLTLKYQKRIVLKSPSHTFKIPYLLKLYPNAKFIYIYRNPYAVFKSAVHLRRTMYDENGMCRPDYGDLEERVFELYDLCFRDYERDKALIPQGNFRRFGSRISNRTAAASGADLSGNQPARIRWAPAEGRTADGRAETLQEEPLQTGPGADGACLPASASGVRLLWLSAADG